MFTAMAVNTCCRWAFGCPRVAEAARAVSVGELVDGALHSGADRVAGLPFGCLLLGADADLQVAEFSPGESPRSGRCRGRWCTGCGPGRAGTALGEPCHDHRGRGGRGGRVGAVPALADLALGAGNLSAVEVDVEVVTAEAFVPAVLAGLPTRRHHAGPAAHDEDPWIASPECG